MPFESIPTRNTICPYKQICAEYLTSLKWTESLFDRRHNRCYCTNCYPNIYQDTYQTGGYTYVIPRGWCRFGLYVDEVRAGADKIWKDWIITYHGTSATAAQSIVAHRQFLIPGDKSFDGKLLGIRPGHIPEKFEIYTSPTIAYASHAAYSPRVTFQSTTTNQWYYARVVLQCRQQPDSYQVQRETVGEGTNRICPFIPNEQVEFFTTVRAAVIPYAILIHLAEAQ